MCTRLTNRMDIIIYNATDLCSIYALDFAVSSLPMM